MPKTLLAVDDSATMRKVFEITFSGEDFRVVTAEGSQTALGKMNEEPRVVLIDTSLGNDDGYALCKEIRRRDPSAALILLSSRHNPYDQAKGRDAGADDFMDKPFDTQQMIDKVRKVLLAHESGAVAAPAPAPAPAAHSPAPAPVQQRPAAPAAFTPQAPPASTVARPAPQRSHTLMFGETGMPATPPLVPAGPTPDRRAEPAPAASARSPFVATRPVADAPRVDAPRAVAPVPAPAPTPKPAAAAPAPAPTPAPPQAAVHAAVATTNGHMAGKLGELGLSPAQVEAVLALSREVVERVVWEVVPQLAETIIKEEISRLTKEA